MLDQKRRSAGASVIAGVLLMIAAVAQAQVLQEDFNTVGGTGGGIFFTGSGFIVMEAWENGIAGEEAFAGAWGAADVGAVSAYGTTTGGIAGTGAGVIDVAGVEFIGVNEDFATASGTGGGNFVTTNGHNTTANWDDGIAGEGAFAGAEGGAILGTVSANGILSGGMGNTRAGRITVQGVNISSGDWYAGLDWATPLPAGSLVNTSFDQYHDWYGDRPDGWIAWEAAYSVAADPGAGLVPRTGDRLLKLWGPGTGAWGNSGVRQYVRSTEGDVWEVDGWAKHITGDSLAGTGNFVLLQIEFLPADPNAERIGVEEITILDANSPLDTWMDVPAFQATAPPGTAWAQCAVRFLQPGVWVEDPPGSGNWVWNAETGAAQIEDVSFRRVSGPPAVDVNALTISADVKGSVSGGKYELRLQDADGDSVGFSATANGNFQHLSGALSGAVETGSFDPDSSAYKLVVAFKDEAATWGSGGMLTVDNLVLTGETAESGWFAGLAWEDLVPTGVVDPARLMLTGDVKGNVIGGAYQLRVEGLSTTPTGVDEGFAAATGTGGGLLLPPDSSGNERFAYTGDWDTGVTGETAYAGVWGGALVTVSGGIWVHGVTSGGYLDNGGAGQIEIRDVTYSTTSGWYAGLAWPGQGLASTDLSEVMLTADIKGSWNPGWGQIAGTYQLRIEDADGDYLAFVETANQDYQSVGGLLSDADTNGTVPGSAGDGIFNVYSPSYTVVVQLSGDENNWHWGGMLTVDNVFLTEATIKHEIGRSVFAGTADGTFQSIGGLLSEGDSNFAADYDEDFAAATGTGGGLFFTSGSGGFAWVNNWDDGIANEEAWAGAWGGAVVGTGVTARSCATCGAGGSKAAQLIAEDIDTNGGGWYAGMTFIPDSPPLGNLDEVYLTADIKGTANTGAGERLGTVVLRIEDGENDYLAFEVTADGTFQSVGGPLSAATAGGSGPFDADAGEYHIVVVFEGKAEPGTWWGTGGTLTIDNLFLTGRNLANADVYHVVVTFDDEVATWGTAGTLTVDNLLLTPVAASCDADDDLDLADFAKFQACFSGDGGGVAGGCDCSDADADEDVDLADYTLVARFLNGPQ